MVFLLETMISEHHVQVSVFFLIACDTSQNLITTRTTIFPYTVKILFTHVLGAGTTNSVAPSNNLITISCITIFPPLSKSFSSIYLVRSFLYLSKIKNHNPSSLSFMLPQAFSPTKTLYFNPYLNLIHELFAIMSIPNYNQMSNRSFY